MLFLKFTESSVFLFFFLPCEMFGAKAYKACLDDVNRCLFIRSCASSVFFFFILHIYEEHTITDKTTLAEHKQRRKKGKGSRSILCIQKAPFFFQFTLVNDTFLSLCYSALYVFFLLFCSYALRSFTATRVFPSLTTKLTFVLLCVSFNNIEPTLFCYFDLRADFGLAYLFFFF